MKYVPCPAMPCPQRGVLIKTTAGEILFPDAGRGDNRYRPRVTVEKTEPPGPPRSK